MSGTISKFARAAVLCTGLSLLISPTVIAQDQDRDHHDDQQQRDQYANNQFYQLGQREGAEDSQHHHKRKSHRHKYTSDEDRRAHDAGYQSGWQGDQHEHNGADNQPHQITY